MELTNKPKAIEKVLEFKCIYETIKSTSDNRRLIDHYKGGYLMLKVFLFLRIYKLIIKRFEEDDFIGYFANTAKNL